MIPTVLVPQNETGVPDRTLLSLLSSQSASTILEALDEPMTVKEVSHLADVPLSTAYREINRLDEVGLVGETIRLDAVRGKHVSEYVRAFETIEVTVDDGGIAVRVVS